MKRRKRFIKKKRVSKVKSLNTNSITPSLFRELEYLFEFSSPCNLKKSILEIYLLYLMQNHETLSVDFERIAGDIYFLIKFLDEAEETGIKKAL